MDQVQALPMGRIAGAKTSDDGQYMLIQTFQSDGQEAIFAIHREQLLPLVDIAALAFTQSNRTLNVPTEQKTTLDVSWWEIGFDKMTGRAVLSLTFGAGGRLDFLLAKSMPEQILETLQTHVGQMTPPRSERPVN